MPETTVAITELLEIDPDRVDAVTSPANGTEWLILKSTDNSETVTDVEGVLAEIAKADDERPDCTTCHGDGKIMGNNRKCPDCKGSGVKPMPGDTEKSLAELAARKEAGAADSGSGETPAKNCGTCGGTGVVGSKQNANQQNECPDCGGTGKDQATVNPDELRRVDAPGGTITEGAGGRETIDKSVCDDDDCDICDDVEKAELKTKARNALDDSDFALPGRQYPIQDAAHARNALARVAQNGTPDEQAKVKAAVSKKYPDINVDGDDDAEKAVLDGSMFTSANPALSSPVAQGSDPGSSGVDDGTPGSPAWEAVDAQTATDAAMALMAAAELIRTFAQRESTEVAVGEGNDIFDTGAAYAALCSVSDALGIMAQMAFHEGVEAAKSLPDDEVVEKAGRRLAGKTIAALAAARDKAKDLASHIGGVLGDDDPAKKSNDDGDKSVADKFISSANKELLAKEIEDMTADELLRLLDERDAQKAANEIAEKTETAEVAETTDAVDVDDDAVKSEDEVATEDAAKAEEPVELTPEQIEAHEAAKAAKKAAKAAKREQEALDQKIALTKSIEESLAKVVEQNEVLKSTVETLTSELEGVKKMAAPSNGIVRTAPADAQNVAKARDEVEVRIATLEHEARITPDPSVRAGNREIIKELRASMTDNKN